MAGRSEILDNPILLVEDSPDDVELTIRALRRNKVENEILVAEDGQKALEILGIATEGGVVIDPLPALVLLDIQLPKLDGHQVLRRIRADERTRFLPVVVLTSSVEERDRAEAYSLGVNSYVQKPIHSEVFTEAVGRLGLYWLVDNKAF
ncbi:two-component system response regulator [Natronospira proteinivora]|uniref:Two-component system response regulator n=1 Tax=Natronospira proteinivora TaxID=1807133 RepID=A0ABT1G7W5_9GAMM|nr:response regulator [Natronospira proteinivora]MCP1726067.1 two-component system response regulator [Natronospira proteinivora]